MDTIVRYESSDFNKTLSALSKYTKYLDREVEELTKNEKLAKNGRVDVPQSEIALMTPAERTLYNSLSLNDETNKQGILIRNTLLALDYLKKFQVIVNRNCENPDTAAVNAIDEPDLDSGTEEHTTLPPSTGTISCSADREAATIGETVTWSVHIDPVADIQSYTWTGLGAIPASTPSVPIKYNKEGTWSASITASILDNNGTVQQSSFLCDNQVVVTQSESTTNPKDTGEQLPN
jgi:hypothetical protein